MNDFFTALQSHKSDPDLPPHVRRVINMRASARRDRIVARMEAHSRVQLGLSAGAAVDWSAKKIDWSVLLKFLEAILPLILALFGL
jgi:hypothetical protein